MQREELDVPAAVGIIAPDILTRSNQMKQMVRQIQATPAWRCHFASGSDKAEPA